MKQLFTFLFLLCAAAAGANISLPAVIGSHMVLQQRSSVKLWGWADSYEKIFVTTSWDGRTDSTVSTGDAKWAIYIQTPAAGGPYTITLKGRNTMVLEDILIGEVWVCSGQSNMEWNHYNGVMDFREELAAGPNPAIRFFHVTRTTAEHPQEDVRASWAVSDTNNMKTFSALAWYFARKLNAGLGVPVGLIHASWGGTPAEVWTPAAVVKQDDSLRQSAAVLQPVRWWTTTPGYAYNAMIAPLTPFRIAGAIWYQGESNTGAPATYAKLMRAMISAWWQQWQQEFPFYQVQIAPFRYGNRNVGALVREAQEEVLSLPRTGMVVISDLVEDTTDIHPRNKRDVGFRLARLALAENYGRTDAGARSPRFKEMSVKKNEVTISFHDAGGGLEARGGKIKELYLAGSDGIFHPAEGRIRGEALIVRSKAVKQPVAVRYAFANTAIGNLFSKSGLPVAPFRSDRWKVDEGSL